jgi:hypothetical protein
MVVCCIGYTCDVRCLKTRNMHGCADSSRLPTDTHIAYTAQASCQTTARRICKVFGAYFFWSHMCNARCLASGNTRNCANSYWMQVNPVTCTTQRALQSKHAAAKDNIGTPASSSHSQRWVSRVARCSRGHDDVVRVAKQHCTGGIEGQAQYHNYA